MIDLDTRPAPVAGTLRRALRAWNCGDRTTFARETGRALDAPLPGRVRDAVLTAQTEAAAGRPYLAAYAIGEALDLLAEEAHR